MESAGDQRRESGAVAIVVRVLLSGAPRGWLLGFCESGTKEIAGWRHPPAAGTLTCFPRAAFPGGRAGGLPLPTPPSPPEDPHPTLSRPLPPAHTGRGKRSKVFSAVSLLSR